MALDIDPTQITEKNVPQVLGAIVVELQNMNSKLDTHMESLEQDIYSTMEKLVERIALMENIQTSHPNCQTHQETLKRLTEIETTLKLHDTLFWTPLLVTKQDILPFLWNYKYIIGGVAAILTTWLAVTDWAVRAIQWGLVPPGQVP